MHPASLLSLSLQLLAGVHASEAPGAPLFGQPRSARRRRARAAVGATDPAPSSLPCPAVVLSKKGHFPTPPPPFSPPIPILPSEHPPLPSTSLVRVGGRITAAPRRNSSLTATSSALMVSSAAPPPSTPFWTVPHFPIFASICRASSMPFPTTGPSHRLGTSMSRHPPSPSPSTHSSGEPSPPPPCQVCCHHPHDAHAALPGAPCSSMKPGRPSHPATMHVATMQ
jgi:hypothetical protein